MSSGEGADIAPGNALPLSGIPTGTTVHNVELTPGRGQLGRSAGAAIQLVAKEGAYATLRLPSGEMRMVPVKCRATIGVLGNAEHELVGLGKAGRSRHRGKRPQTRGVAMNPVDHPRRRRGSPHAWRPPGHPWGCRAATARRSAKASARSSSVAAGAAKEALKRCRVRPRRARSSRSA